MLQINILLMTQLLILIIYFKLMAYKGGKDRDLGTFIFDFTISGISTAFSKTITSPIEVIKLRLQNFQAMLKSGSLDRGYGGIIDCGRRIISEQGVKGLWKGNGANIIKYFPTQFFNFSFNDYFKRLFIKDKIRDGQLAWILGNLASGGAAGFTSLLFIHPFDFVRIRLSNDLKSARWGGEKQYKGIIDVYKQTIASDGLAGFYRGFAITCISTVMYRALYFGIYGSVKPILPEDLKNNLFFNFLLGWGITVGTGLACYPLDTIKTRMMMTSGEPQKFSGSIDCARQILNKEGIKSFFRGAGVSVLRGITGGGALMFYNNFVFPRN